jgi:alkylation response protein AidB-like acyl-CoA dehydrogenase
MSATNGIAGLEEVAAVAAEHAAQVDVEATFPEAALEAARARGLLGLVSAKEVGGRGGGMRAAVDVITRLARECGSTAMVLSMHYASVPVVEKLGGPETRRRVAAGEQLLTLAFSEVGSRSHFWAPLSTARRDGRDLVLDAQKSFVTAANRAHAYVWSSKPVEAKGESTLWLVRRDASGLSRPAAFNGLGLRGNDSAPVKASGVRVSDGDRLGADGGGFQTMMEVVLPWFNLVNAACSVGLMEALLQRTAAHVTATRHAHLDTALADLPTIRAYLSRMRIDADLVRTLLGDTLAAIEGAREDATLRVLEVKAAAGETATAVGDLAMRVCGGAAFSKEVGVERYFRDARAATVMGPTTDVLYDFIGKALTGRNLF